MLIRKWLCNRQPKQFLVISSRKFRYGSPCNWLNRLGGSWTIELIVKQRQSLEFRLNVTLGLLFIFWASLWSVIREKLKWQDMTVTYGISQIRLWKWKYHLLLYMSQLCSLSVSGHFLFLVQFLFWETVQRFCFYPLRL